MPRTEKRGVIVRGALPLVDAVTVRFLQNLAKHHGPIWAAPDQALLAPEVSLDDLRYMLRQLSCVAGVVDSVLKPPTGLLTVSFPHAALLQCLAVGLGTPASIDELLPPGCSVAAVPARPPQPLVLLTGCFDLIHSGHVRLIEAATTYSRQPLVAMLTSRGISVQPKNRGDRPFWSMADRLTILRSLRFRIRVILFDGPDSLDIIRALRPNLWIKEEQDRERLIVQEEARLVESLGGNVVWVSDHCKRSSTEIAEAVRVRCVLQANAYSR